MLVQQEKNCLEELLWDKPTDDSIQTVTNCEEKNILFQMENQSAEDNRDKFLFVTSHIWLGAIQK